MKQKDIIIILVPLFLITILWVIFNIYHNIVTSTIKDPLSFQIIDIPNKFDTKTIENTKNRQRVEPNFIFEATTTTESVAPLDTPLPTASPSAINTQEDLPIGASPTPEVSQ